MIAEHIKIFQVDDWAYIAAASAEEAGEFCEKEFSRNDDPEDNECEEVIRGRVDSLEKLLQDHINEGGAFPALIGVDGHYA